MIQPDWNTWCNASHVSVSDSNAGDKIRWLNPDDRHMLSIHYVNRNSNPWFCERISTFSFRRWKKNKSLLSQWSNLPGNWLDFCWNFQEVRHLYSTQLVETVGSWSHGSHKGVDFSRFHNGPWVTARSVMEAHNAEDTQAQARVSNGVQWCFN